MHGLLTAFQRLDLVRLAGGQRLIVIDYHPNRPANPWTGVLEGGKGKVYKFGYKHHPEKIGVAAESHPALVAMGERSVSSGTGADKGMVTALVELVLSSDDVIRGADLEFLRSVATRLRNKGY